MDREFKIQFNSSSNSFSNIKFQKIGGILKDTKMDSNGKPNQDIYYDEVIYYDGGGVEGYGNN